MVFDFDGTITTDDGTKYPEMGDINEEVAARVRRCKEAGLRVIISSCRWSRRIHAPEQFEENRMAVASFLKAHNVPYDDLWFPDKPFSSFICDDISVNPKDLVALDSKIDETIEKQRAKGEVSKDKQWGCLMAEFPGDFAGEVTAWTATNIPDAILYDKVESPGKYGREDHIHATVRYGFEPNIQPQEIEAFLGRFARMFPLQAKLGPIEKFSKADYDVIKVGIISEDLHTFNTLLADLFGGINNFPDYKPHMTLAYVLPGQGDSLLGQAPFEGREFNLGDFDYSSSDEPSKSSHYNFSVPAKSGAVVAAFEGETERRVGWVMPDGKLTDHTGGDEHIDLLEEPHPQSLQEAYAAGWSSYARNPESETLFVCVGHDKPIEWVISKIPEDLRTGNTEAIIDTTTPEGKPAKDYEIQLAMEDDILESIRTRPLRGESSLNTNPNSRANFGRWWIDPSGEAIHMTGGEEHTEWILRHRPEVVAKGGPYAKGWIKVNADGLAFSDLFFSSMKKFVLGSVPKDEWAHTTVELSIIGRVGVSEQGGDFTVRQVANAKSWAELKRGFKAAASDGKTKYWVSPEGKANQVDDQHLSTLIELGHTFPESNKAPKVAAFAAGWARVWENKDTLYVEMKDLAKVNDVLFSLPSQMLNRKILWVEERPDKGRGRDFRIDVEPGENVADAWERGGTKVNGSKVGEWHAWRTLGGASYEGVIKEVDCEDLIVLCTDGITRAVTDRENIAAAKGEDKFTRLYKKANEAAQQDVKWAGIPDDPRLAQEFGEFQQAVREARTEEELQNAWERFSPTVSWDAIVGLADSGEKEGGDHVAETKVG